MKIADIPAARLAALNAGLAETTTLTECLAVDFAALRAAVFPGLAGVDVDSSAGIVQRMTAMGALLVDQDEALTHASDTVRGWAAFAVAAVPRLSFAERLRRVRPLADDGHFGVREWAWLALRPHLAAELAEGLRLLVPFTQEASENLRRFASELTRPRGVWCAHLARLKAEPELGLVLLEPLRADESRYVQDSVANWLNDAAKSQAAWVRDVCARWLRESDCVATRRICQRALRSVTR